MTTRQVQKGPSARPAGAWRAWWPVDGLVVAYAAWVMLLVAATGAPAAGALLVVHAAVIGLVALLPRRDAGWERRRLDPGPLAVARDVARFLRHVYPLPLMLLFFEEVRFTVNAVFPEAPYWFEPYLYTGDRALFGVLPAVAMADWTARPVVELLHLFYFSYYLILIGGVAGPYVVEVRAAGRPGAGFSAVLHAMTAAFLLSFLPYPFLAARGPWENAALMGALPELRGVVFEPLMDLIIAHGAVPGGCFPSAHVAGAWGIVFGLAHRYRRAALWTALGAAAMSFACVYTRYHHGVDVPAGFLCGALGGWFGVRMARRH